MSKNKTEVLKKIILLNKVKKLIKTARYLFKMLLNRKKILKNNKITKYGDERKTSSGKFKSSKI